jgi:HD-GYP domain-containing protein (c-di-GMP phosphodiesterase class II)
MSGMNNRVFMDAENAKKIFRAFNEVYVTGIPQKGYEWETIRKDGARTYIEVSVSLIAMPGEKPTGFCGIARDITNRKKAEENLKETLESLRKAVGATIQVMVSAVETRDPYTAGHQLRSADLARAIATEMGLPQDRIDGIRMAGSIHDIGKLSIPAEILSKPTKLSALELTLIKEHARQGYEILKGVESPWPLAEIVHQHHERMDGSGYPRNLKGEEILIEARILAVSDVVESMASHRPYRPALGIEAALEEIVKNKGILYDDAVADACLRLFREKGFELEGA